MKFLHALLAILTSTSLVVASEIGAPVISPKKAFSISQTYDAQSGWISKFTFLKDRLISIDLDPTGISWAADYSISPDSQWILRIQKTGSGDNIGILYHVESNHRISVTVGFNESLWAASDAHARLSKRQLYHTAISNFSWDASSRFLTITMVGSNAEKSGDGIETTIKYDLIKNSFSTVN